MTGFALHLLRHGAPIRPGLLLGHLDMPSSDAGCVSCFERGKSLAVETVLCSDLQRARRPAELIAGWQDLPVRPDRRWRELDFGEWDGCDPATLPPAPLAAFHRDPDASPPPGGESWAALCARTRAALADIDRPTLVVAHGGSIRAALACLLGWDQRQTWGLALPYAALVSLAVWPGATADAPMAAQITGLLT